MDQSTVVTEQTEGGKRLIESLELEGFNVWVAFWAKTTEEGKWYLYLASQIVDENGPATAYRRVHDLLRKMPELWIDLLDIKVIGLNDNLAKAAYAVVKPRIPDSPYAVRNPRSYPGMTQLGGSTLGGVRIEGAYIYPPSHEGTPV